MYKKYYTTLFPERQKTLLVNFSLAVIFVAIAGFILLPVPYVVEKPGPTVNVLGSENNHELISYTENNEQPTANSVITNTTTTNFGGELMLLTVTIVGGPGSYTNAMSLMPALVSSEQDILPTEAVYKPKMSVEDARKETNEQMTESQNTAVIASTDFLAKNGTTISPDDVKLAIDDIGGPSAGLVFSLGILQKIGRMDITHGKKIAATGTISDQGEVGAIGGVQQKMIAAQAKGADILLVPAVNYRELTNIPNNLKVIAVKTLAEAVSELAKLP